MTETRSELLGVMVEPSLATKIRAEAEEMGHSVSGYIRYCMRRIVDPDAVTIERARHLVDPGVTYETEAE